MKRLKTMFQAILELREDPEHIAFSFALGVFLGFSPLLGFHTLLGLALAFWLRLNKVAVLLGVYVNAPWVIAPYYALSLLVGTLILGVPGIEMPTSVGFTQLFSLQFWGWVAAQWRLLIPVFLGSTILCTLFSLMAYGGMLRLLRRRTPRQSLPPSSRPAAVTSIAPESTKRHDSYS